MPTYLSDPLFQQSQNVCSSTTLSPHALFMGRPLASSESLDKSSERFLSSFLHSSFFALIKYIKWTAIEGNFLFKKNNQAAAPLVSFLFIIYFQLFNYFFTISVFMQTHLNVFLKIA